MAQTNPSCPDLFGASTFRGAAHTWMAGLRRPKVGFGRLKAGSGPIPAGPPNGYSSTMSSRLSMASQIIASILMPSKRLISWMPVGEVTLISVM